MATQPTPEQMAQNIIKGVKEAYVFVGVRHVHPWYSWALMAAAIGFVVGVGYVANRQGSFDESQAAKMPLKDAPVVASRMVTKIEMPGRLAQRINAAIEAEPNGALAKIEKGRVIDLARGPGVFFDAPRPYNLRSTQGAAAFSADLKSFLSGTQPFRVSIGNSSANEWLAFGSTGTIPAGFSKEGRRCDCKGSVTFNVICTIDKKEYVVTRGPEAMLNALDNAKGPEAHQEAIVGSYDPKKDVSKLADDNVSTLAGKNHLSCPEENKCESNLEACIPKELPGSVYEVLAISQGSGYDCKAKADGVSGITSTCNAAVVNPAK